MPLFLCIFLSILSCSKEKVKERQIGGNMKKIFDVLNVIKQKLFVKKDKIHSEKYYRRIDFLNKYSLLFHAIIAMAIVFIVEIISRRSFISACKFVDAHTLAFMYNSFLVFVSFSLVYLLMVLDQKI